MKDFSQPASWIFFVVQKDRPLVFDYCKRPITGKIYPIIHFSIL